jgi:hypothetical protein
LAACRAVSSAIVPGMRDNAEACGGGSIRGSWSLVDAVNRCENRPYGAGTSSAKARGNPRVFRSQGHKVRRMRQRSVLGDDDYTREGARCTLPWLC